MKNLYTLNFITLITAATLVLGGCNSESKAEDPKKTAEEHNENKFDNEKEATAAFLVYAADLNMAEIQLGELAQGNGHSAEIKNMGKMMIDDHTKALAEIKTIAASKSVTLPASISDEKKKECDKLNEEKGHDFDKEYADLMVESHKDAITKFEKEAEEGKDEEVRAFAVKMLPSLRAHMDHSMVCQKNAENKKDNDTAVAVKNKDIKEYKNKEDGTTSKPAKEKSKKEW